MIAPGLANATGNGGRAWRRLLPALAFALLLAGCRFGEPTSLLDDDAAIAKALSGIQSRYSGPMPTIGIAINDTEMVVQARNPSNAREIVEWRLVREQSYFVNYDRVYGPQTVDRASPGRTFDRRLFDLKDVNFAAWGKIADAAVARAALKDKGGVSSIELARPAMPLPSKSGSPARWTFEVKSASETVRVFANADGDIVRVSAVGRPGAPINMYQRPDLAEEAAAEIRQELGNAPVLRKVSFSSSRIGFSTTLRDDSHPAKFSDSSSIRATAAYNWSPEGLRSAMGSIDTSAVFSNPDAPFSVDDVDWALLPKIVADAQAALAMPGARISTIDVYKPTDGVGVPMPLWKIEIGESKERGTYIADTKGAVKNVLLPESRRKRIDWLDPGVIADTLVRIGKEFGPNAMFESITVYDSYVNIYARDPRKPGDLVNVHLREGGFSRFGNATPRPPRPNDFQLEQFQLTRDQVAAMIERTLAARKLPPGSLTRVTLGRNSYASSRGGGVPVELRAESRGVGSMFTFEAKGSDVRLVSP